MDWFLILFLNNDWTNNLKLSSLKSKVNKILLIQPIQVDENEIDIRIALN